MFICCLCLSMYCIIWLLTQLDFGIPSAEKFFKRNCFMVVSKVNLYRTVHKAPSEPTANYILKTFVLICSHLHSPEPSIVLHCPRQLEWDHIIIFGEGGVVEEMLFIFQDWSIHTHLPSQKRTKQIKQRSTKQWH